MGILQQLFGHELEDVQDEDIAQEFVSEFFKLYYNSRLSRDIVIEALNKIIDEWFYQDDMNYFTSCVLTWLIYEIPELEKSLFEQQNDEVVS